MKFVAVIAGLALTATPAAAEVLKPWSGGAAPPLPEVTIAVRAPSGRERELTVERAEVRIPAVRGEVRRAEGVKIGYLQLHTFSQGAHGELREEAERLARRGAEGLVLDLRGNGGGLLNEAVLGASVFVEDGVVVSTRSRARGEQDYEAVGEALDPRPLVVLVNRDTASAAEILTAALETHLRSLGAEPARLPWYYKLPGAKHLIDHDIREAREHLGERGVVQLEQRDAEVRRPAFRERLRARDTARRRILEQLREARARRADVERQVSATGLQHTSSPVYVKQT